MKYKRIALTWAVVLLGLAASLLILTTLSAANVPSRETPAPVQVISIGEPVQELAPAQEIHIIYPPGPWPPYAQEAITIHPEPPLPGQPAEICAEVINQDLVEPHMARLDFGVAPLGLGMPFLPIGMTEVEVPPGGAARGCIGWVPPKNGPWSIEVLLAQDTTEEVQRSQRNLDMQELLRPGQPHTLIFPVGNFSAQPITVTLGFQPHLDGWDFDLTPSVIANLTPNESVSATLTVWPPAELPPDMHPIVDVEGFVQDEMIGGFRKIFRPPVPLHRNQDPFFAESEINVWPYPPQAGEPTEICVDLYNWTDEVQMVETLFSWANFGIGLAFHPIEGPQVAEIPPHGRQTVCMVWIPETDGHFCIQVELHHLGEFAYAPQFSQRNLDVDEPLHPGIAHTMTFPVGNFPNQFTNPDPEPMPVWLEADVLLPGWEVVLTPEEVPEIPPFGMEWFTITVTPPPGPLPPDNVPIVDVRAMTLNVDEPRVLGGFRKLYRPPVPLHPFPDPTYAEREISIHPYPPLAGEPTEVCVELRNPTTDDQNVIIHFAWAKFGIGLPFTPINGPRPVHLPPHSIVRECIHWIPPVDGQIGLEVLLEIMSDEPEIYPVQRSQRNIDVIEPLEPGVPDQFEFQVRNPFDHPAMIEFGLIPHQPGWGFTVEPFIIPELDGGDRYTVTLTVFPPDHLPPDGSPIVDVEAFANGELIGGFRKIYRPPIPLHPFPDPPYAEREITIHPYPPRAGEPTEVCVDLRNPTPVNQAVIVRFAWAHFGIGQTFYPINGPRTVDLPPHSIIRECIHWVPPIDGQLCLEVSLEMLGHDPVIHEPQRSRLNIDINEPLEAEVAHSLIFPVRNPFERPVTITLGLVPHLPEWVLELSEDTLINVPQGETRPVTLTVVPPADLPPDGATIVDVEAFADGRLIGGFRKIYRPPVPIHRPRDPMYAESEIFIHPYPPRAQEPAEIGVEIRNPTLVDQPVLVKFSYADFGIGLPFEPIHEPIEVVVPAEGMIRPVIMWIPPHGGLFCIEVELIFPGEDEGFISRRNMDVGEPLEPLVPHSRSFPVRNPFDRPVTITLGLVPHLPEWGLELSQDVLENVKPAEFKEVILTVTPPADLPPDGAPIVDVEAFVDGQLIGGFRKIFRPPVPIHRPRDPVYAESEIGIDPYPAIPGQPTQLSVEVFNPTDKDRLVKATFSVAPFGIGLPFKTEHITPNPITIFVPANGAARGHVIWLPPDWAGKFCVKVTLEMEGQDPIWSQRNIDVGEPLQPGQPHSLQFPVGNPTNAPVTVTLGLVNHREDWQVSLSHDTVANLPAGETAAIILTVEPPLGAELGFGDPIVDVEAFIEGELIGGFRKLDRPPIPLHKPHEKGYAESEIRIIPYPPQQGQINEVSTIVQNTSDQAMTVELEFGWAKFGMGIPFTNTGMSPYKRSVTLGPAMTKTVSVEWKPALAGPQCVMILMSDPDGVYEPQRSQRNVDVVERPPCDETKVFSFTVHNDSAFSVTVDLGMITFNVPADWQISTVPSGTMVLEPFADGTVMVLVRIPCPRSLDALLSAHQLQSIQQASGSVPLVDVEGYVKGKLVGGIELQFAPRAVQEKNDIYLPTIVR